MKNTFKLFGIISLLVIIGFSFAACKEDNGGTAPTITTATLPDGMRQFNGYF